MQHQFKQYKTKFFIKPKRIEIILFLSLLLASASCEDSTEQKIQETNNYPKSNPLPERSNGDSHSGRIATSNLDWENTEFFYYRNPSNIVLSALPPWAFRTSSVIPDVISYDNKKVNGWVLVYHTFNPTVNLPVYHPVLVLYNKFRGIMRMFYYNINQPPQGSNYLARSITFDSAPTSQLNFSSEFSKPTHIKQYQPFEISSNISQFNNGLALGTWYYFDYELAYDETIKNLSEDAITLGLRTWAVQETLLDVTGSIQGTLDGYIKGSGSGVSLFNNFISGVELNSLNVSRDVFSSTGQEAKVSLESKIALGINDALASSISSSLGKLATQGLDFVTSPLSTLFNNILATSIDDKQRVHLALSAKVALKGTLRNSSLMYNLQYAVPGTLRDKNLPGYAPYYDKTLGLFNINNTPKVTATSVTTGTTRTALKTTTTFVLDVNSFAPVFNPEVTAEVDIINVKKQIIWFKKYKGSIPYSLITPTSGGTLVNITADNEWYLYNGNTFKVSRTGSSAWASIGIRLSFTVVPKNGAPPVYIVKTITPDILEQ